MAKGVGFPHPPFYLGFHQTRRAHRRQTLVDFFRIARRRRIRNNSIRHRRGRRYHARFTLRTNRTLLALWTSGTGGTLFALDTLNALFTLRTSRTYGTLFALDTLNTLFTLRTSRTYGTLFALNPLDALFALRTGRAYGTLFTLNTLNTLFALRTGRTLRTYRACDIARNR